MPHVDAGAERCRARRIDRPSAQEVEEVIVTARKKAENLQDVPISVQAYSGEHVAEKGIIDLQTMRRRFQTSATPKPSAPATC